MKKTFIILLVLVIAFTCCRTNRLTHISMNDVYNSDADFAKLEQVVYHVSDSISRLYFQLESNGLLYTKDLRENHFKSRYSIHLELFNVLLPKVIADSSTFLYSDTANYTKRNTILDSIDLKIKFPGNYFLSITLADLNRNVNNSIYISLEKDNYNSRQNFKVTYENGLPLFKPYISNTDRIIITSRNRKVPHLFVRNYRAEYPIALPPFIETKSKGYSFSPDSVFFIEMNDGCSQIVSFNEAGIYHIQTDTSTRKGLTIFRFAEDFPKITTAIQMLLPLRYISSKAEFGDMMMMKDTKEAVDDFWLNKAGNPDRAKELIRKYYTRVIESNRYFTSYHEGWKTDRGLIYIVYGAPNLVYRNPDNETWIYGEDRNVLSITFVFNKVDNPFSDNDYELERSQDYKDTWYTAVDGWRN
jgi:GWxTD domain-containing protein